MRSPASGVARPEASFRLSPKGAFEECKEAEDENDGEAEDGNLDPRLRLHQSDRSIGSALLQNARAFLTGFLLFPSQIVLVSSSFSSSAFPKNSFEQKWIEMTRGNAGTSHPPIRKIRLPQNR